MFIENGLMFEYFDVNHTKLALVNADVSDEELTIPARVRNHPVCAISQNVFLRNKNIREVFVPDSVLSIGRSAFEGCSELKIVCFYRSQNPATLVEIESRAFRDCEKLEMFQSTLLVSVASMAFYGCKKLMEVQSKVTSVDKQGFYRCKNLRRIAFGEYATWENNSFTECKRLSRIEFYGKINNQVLKHSSKLGFLENKEIVCSPRFNYFEIAYTGTSVEVLL